MNLATELPRLLPKAIAWAEVEATAAAESGRSLDASEVRLAQSVGVSQPERVRVAVVHSLPTPEDADLRAAALLTGLLGPAMVGLTLGHSILICRGHEATSLLTHELRHVQQYENAGSIAAFLPAYLQQIVMFGYANAPLERDARAHEVVDRC